MFKVSFKENKKFPVKKVERIEHTRETIVTLKGTVKLPLFLQCYIPSSVLEWMDTCKNVQVELTMTQMHLTIRGKARRSENDTDNPVFGERIAECRAKINLYKYIATLCCMITRCYEKFLYGDNALVLKEAIVHMDNIDSALRKYNRLWNSEYEHLQNLLAHEPDHRTEEEMLADLKRKMDEPDTESSSQP